MRNMKTGIYDYSKLIKIPNFLGVFWPRAVNCDRDILSAVTEAVLTPVEALPLPELVQMHHKITVVIDDFTRVTPTSSILKVLFATVPTLKKKAQIIIALGTHRAMSSEEVRRKAGIFADIVKQHEWWNPDLLKRLDFRWSTPVLLNRYVLDADVVIGIGHIAPHRVTGFSGGSKIILPGVAGLQTTGALHWMSAQHPLEEIFGVIENPVRALVDSVAVEAGLTFIINTIHNSEGEPVKIIAGDPIRAHRIGCRTAKEICKVEIPEKVDIAIVDAAPTDIDLWQAAKAISAGALVVKDGGTLILVARCPEGVCPQFPEVERYGYLPLAEVQELVRQGVITDLNVAAHLAFTGEILKPLRKAYLISDGISSATAKRLGFSWSPGLERAVEEALRYYGSRATCAVIMRAGETLPVVSGEERGVDFHELAT